MFEFIQTKDGNAWYDKIKFISTTQQISSGTMLKTEKEAATDTFLVLKHMDYFDRSVEKDMY